MTRRALTRRARPLAFALLAFGIFGSGAATAGPPEEGQPAPPFELVGTDGRTHTLADYAGKRGVVLAWFPKAFTPG